MISEVSNCQLFLEQKNSEWKFAEGVNNLLGVLSHKKATAQMYCILAFQIKLTKV
jgi:hypothetical protein